MSKEVDHGSRAHALLSPSSAKRWINCTPSARLEEHIPEGPEKPYAVEGTLAHEVAELTTRLALQLITPSDFSKSIEVIEKQALEKEFNFSDMQMYADKYAEYIMTIYHSLVAKDNTVEIQLESKVDLTANVPEGFGSVDCNIVGISSKVLHVIDYKYGKGVVVSAVKNEQMMTYASGIVEHYSLETDFDKIVLHIYQPRAFNFSRYEMTGDELRKWVKGVLIPRAEMAFKGEGIPKAGSWCTFCKVAYKCGTLSAEAAKAAKVDPKSVHTLSDSQVLTMYKKLETLNHYIKSVEEYVHATAKSGKHWPGYKLVNGQTRRIIIDKDEAIGDLRMAGFEDVTEEKPLSLEKLEKIVGGSKELQRILGENLGRSTPSIILVPESDSRREVKIDTARDDFGPSAEDDFGGDL